jgi:hypothetical protein
LSSYLLSTSKNVKIKKYKIITLPIILYQCENVSLLREEQGENGMLRRIFRMREEDGKNSPHWSCEKCIGILVGKSVG